MRVRTMVISAAMIIAGSMGVRAQSDAAKPHAKAARVPPTAKATLADAVKPQLKADTEPGVRGSDRVPSAPLQAHEVTQLARTLKGSYSCSGSIAIEAGGRRKTIAHMTVASDLDGAWLTFDIAEPASADTPFPTKLHIDRTYCSDMRTWTSVLRDNSGTLQITTAEHGGNDTATWTGTAQRDGVKVRVRTQEERDDRAGTIHMRGEVSADGKTYLKQYDLTCTK